MNADSAGVLCLQGSSEPHLARLRDLGFAPREVRQCKDLDGLTHLILPGGESTTIRHLLDLFGLTRELIERHRDGRLCLFGTCAGAILLGQEDGTRPPRLGLLDVAVTRNAYGRQVDSFSTELALMLEEIDDHSPFHGVFIRAPRFARIGPTVRVLARRDEEAVLVEAPGLLAATFHPELTRDLRVHRHFVEMVPVKARARAM